MDKLKHENIVVGVKQVMSAVRSGTAESVYIACDADADYTEPIRELCEECGIMPICVKTRKELGRACGVDVKTAAAAVLKAKTAVK